MAFVRHGTLTANTVTTITLPARRFYRVEITNVDGASRIYALVTENNPAMPTVGGDDCEVLPASMNSLELPLGGGSPVAVKLISSGTPAFSVRAE